MYGHPHLRQLARFSAHLEELFTSLSARGGRDPLPAELADEIAATAGEIMVELAEHRADELVRDVIDDARRLRELARTVCPEAAPVAEAGRVLVGDLARVIKDERRAA